MLLLSLHNLLEYAVGYLLCFKAQNNKAAIFHSVCPPSSQLRVCNLDLCRRGQHMLFITTCFPIWMKLSLIHLSENSPTWESTLSKLTRLHHENMTFMMGTAASPVVWQAGAAGACNPIEKEHSSKVEHFRDTCSASVSIKSHQRAWHCSPKCCQGNKRQQNGGTLSWWARLNRPCDRESAADWLLSKTPCRAAEMRWGEKGSLESVPQLCVRQRGNLRVPSSPPAGEQSACLPKVGSVQERQSPVTRCLLYPHESFNVFIQAWRLFELVFIFFMGWPPLHSHLLAGGNSEVRSCSHMGWQL